MSERFGAYIETTEVSHTLSLNNPNTYQVVKVPTFTGLFRCGYGRSAR